jgi:hypothetical protein
VIAEIARIFGGNLSMFFRVVNELNQRGKDKKSATTNVEPPTYIVSSALAALRAAATASATVG